MKRRQFLLAGAGTLAMPALMRKAWAAEPEVTLKLHHFLGPKSPAQTKMLEPWAQSIEQDSGGRVKIEIYPVDDAGRFAAAALPPGG